MHYTLITIGLLVCSNVFMTFAWYGHLRNMEHMWWLWAALVSWGIALFEYLIMVPANRIGATQAGLNVGQLKILQEVITLSVFVPIAVLYLRWKPDWNFAAAALCIVAAVFFVMRSGTGASKSESASVTLSQ
jgi:uncharacterized protein